MDTGRYGVKAVPERCIVPGAEVPRDIASVRETSRRLSALREEGRVHRAVQPLDLPRPPVRPTRRRRRRRDLRPACKRALGKGTHAKLPFHHHHHHHTTAAATTTTTTRLLPQPPPQSPPPPPDPDRTVPFLTLTLPRPRHRHGHGHGIRHCHFLYRRDSCHRCLSGAASCCELNLDPRLCSSCQRLSSRATRPPLPPCSPTRTILLRPLALLLLLPLCLPLSLPPSLSLSSPHTPRYPSTWLHLQFPPRRRSSSSPVPLSPTSLHTAPSFPLSRAAGDLSSPSHNSLSSNLLTRRTTTTPSLSSFPRRRSLARRINLSSSSSYRHL